MTFADKLQRAIDSDCILKFGDKIIFEGCEISVTSWAGQNIKKVINHCNNAYGKFIKVIYNSNKSKLI